MGTFQEELLQIVLCTVSCQDPSLHYEEVDFFKKKFSKKKKRAHEHTYKHETQKIVGWPHYVVVSVSLLLKPALFQIFGALLSIKKKEKKTTVMHIYTCSPHYVFPKVLLNYSLVSFSRRPLVLITSYVHPN